MVYSSNSPSASLMPLTLNFSAWLLVKERLKWTLSNSQPSRNGNHLPLSKVFVLAWNSRTFIANSFWISLMLSPCSTSSPGKTNLGLGALFNNVCSKPLRTPSLDLYSPFPMLPSHCRSWPMPLYLLLVLCILLQADANGDLHPCAYFSCTFLPAKQNNDIYNHKLLAVILALME